MNTVDEQKIPESQIKIWKLANRNLKCAELYSDKPEDQGKSHRTLAYIMAETEIDNCLFCELDNCPLH